jgi:hypothetical protein
MIADNHLQLRTELETARQIVVAKGRYPLGEQATSLCSLRRDSRPREFSDNVSVQ